MHQNDSSGGGAKCLDATHNLQVEPAGFAYGLDLGMKGEKDDSKLCVYREPER